MADHGKALESQATHDFDLIPRHGALGIAGMVLAARRLARWFGRVAVASQIRGYDGVAGLDQSGRHLVPCQMVLRMAVKQQDRRPLPIRRPSGGDADAGTAGLDITAEEAGHQGISRHRHTPSGRGVSWCGPAERFWTLVRESVTGGTTCA